MSRHLPDPVEPRPRRTAPRSAPNGSPSPGDLHRQQQRHVAFIATLAHELRQPLAAIAQSITVVRALPGSETATRALDIIARQTEQVKRLLEDVLEAARAARGVAALHLEMIDLRRTVEVAGLDAAPTAAARSHKLVVSTPSSPLWVEADAARLQQVLSNLLDNAIKYTEPGGHIWLTARGSDAELTVSVRDTGRGVEPGAMAYIFEPFAQITPDTFGLGLGLSVVREIVTLHRGRIEAWSDGPGKGSEFVVRLPMVRPPAHAGLASQ